MELFTQYTLNVALTCGRSHPPGPGLSSWMWRSGSPGPDLLRPGSGPFYLGGRKNTKYFKHVKLKHLNQLHSHKQFEFMSQPWYHPPVRKWSSTCTGLRNINVLTGALYWNHLEVIFLRGPGQPSSPPGLLHPRNLPEGISDMIISDSHICLTVNTIMATVNVFIFYFSSSLLSSESLSLPSAGSCKPPTFSASVEAAPSTTSSSTSSSCSCCSAFLLVPFSARDLDILKFKRATP